MTWYVVDGMDGSGKSTVAGIIARNLESRGRRVAVITHPNRDTKIGRAELSMLRKEGKVAMLASTSLYIIDILHSLRMRRGKALRGYDDVIFVRYSMAVAYLSDRLCGTAYRVITCILPVPDVTVLMDVDPRTAMDRIRDRGEDLEMFETIEKLESVRRRMLSVSDGWIVIENTGDVAELEKRVLSEVLPADDSP